MTPQHLKDMIGMPAGEGRLSLLSALFSFVHFVLRGELLTDVRPIFFGATWLLLTRKEVEFVPLPLVALFGDWWPNVQVY